MVKKAFLRYEEKFCITKEQMDFFLSECGHRFRPDGDQDRYLITNIYYDTEDSALIRHSIGHPYFKEKLRLRCYGVAPDTDAQVFLELKKKINGIVNKRRAVLSLGEAQNFLENRIHPKNSDYMTDIVLKEIDFFLDHHNKVKPSVFIGYQRLALKGLEDPSLRLTFDTNVLTRRYDLNLTKGFYGDYLLAPDTYIMEIKVPAALPIWLSNALAKAKIYNRSFSKYGTEYIRSQKLQMEEKFHA